MHEVTSKQQDARSAAATSVRHPTAVAQPTIYIAQADHDLLSTLVGSASGSSPGAALLREELDRAVLLPDVPAGVVKLGSTVRCRQRETGKVRTLRLVTPDRADIDAGRVSVLSPVGAALLGAASGQAFAYEAAPGRVHVLEILDVEDGHAGA